MDRKEFLSMLGISSGALIVAGCMGGCSKSSSTTAPTNVDFTLDLTQTANAPLNTAGGYIYSNGLIVAKTSSGSIIAVSKGCTHEGEDVVYQDNNSAFYCPRHGATFGTTGSVTKGPANTALTQYKVTVAGNSVRIQS
jgi:cytochrome b6-f complex iron-sulfur subunit